MIRCYYCNSQNNIMNYKRLSICAICHNNHKIYCDICGEYKNIYEYDINRMPRIKNCISCAPSPQIEPDKLCIVCRDRYPITMPFKRRICDNCYQFKSKIFANEGYNSRDHRICTSCNHVFEIDKNNPPMITCSDCRMKSMVRAKRRKDNS